jgi:hypothetical protein
MMHYYEALAKCILPMVKNQRFGTNQAKEACDIASNLFVIGEIDGELCAKLLAKIGNHSTMRQWGIKHGYIPEKNAARLRNTRWPEDDLSVALNAAVAKAKH